MIHSNITSPYTGMFVRFIHYLIDINHFYSLYCYGFITWQHTFIKNELGGKNTLWMTIDNYKPAFVAKYDAVLSSYMDWSRILKKKSGAGSEEVKACFWRGGVEAIFGYFNVFLLFGFRLRYWHALECFPVIKHYMY